MVRNLMTNFKRPSFSLVAVGTAALLSLPLTATAQTVQTLQATPALANAHNEVSITQHFTPRATSSQRIDFDIWDAALKEFVLYGGPSLRKRARRPQALVGSRFVHGHTSPYRMEGNRIVYEFMKDEFQDNLELYVQDLIEVGNRVDIPSLPRNEQLAYWLNLHNALIITTIAEDYPVSNPSRIKGEDGLRLHDTKLATIDGIALSLRDIRENIVYRHWRDPRVIYGFFHGDVGSPSIQRKAFTGDNVFSVLTYSADEFVNSLRAVELRNDAVHVSRLYKDAAPYYFPDFEKNVRAHLKQYAHGETSSDLNDGTGFLKVASYEDVIADLTAGDGNRRPISNVVSQDARSWGSNNSTIDRALREHRQKREELRRNGLSGVVIIEDIETDPEQTEPPEVE